MADPIDDFNKRWGITLEPETEPEVNPLDAFNQRWGIAPPPAPAAEQPTPSVETTPQLGEDTQEDTVLTPKAKEAIADYLKTREGTPEQRLTSEELKETPFHKMTPRRPLETVLETQEATAEGLSEVGMRILAPALQDPDEPVGRLLSGKGSFSDLAPRKLRQDLLEQSQQRGLIDKLIRQLVFDPLNAIPGVGFVGAGRGGSRFSNAAQSLLSERPISSMPSLERYLEGLPTRALASDVAHAVPSAPGTAPRPRPTSPFAQFAPPSARVTERSIIASPDAPVLRAKSTVLAALKRVADNIRRNEKSVEGLQSSDVAPGSAEHSVQELLKKGGYQRPLQSAETLEQQDRRIAGRMRRISRELETGDENLLTDLYADDVDEMFGLDLPRRPGNTNILDPAPTARMLRSEAEKIDQGIAGRIQRLYDRDFANQESAIAKGIAAFKKEQRVFERLDKYYAQRAELVQELEAISSPRPSSGLRERVSGGGLRAVREGPRNVIGGARDAELTSEGIRIRAAESIPTIDGPVQQALETSPKGQAPQVNGMPTGQVKPAPFVDEITETATTTPQLAKQELDQALYQPVADNAMDVAASKYWAGGSYGGYVDDIPPTIVAPEIFGNYKFRHVGRALASSLDPTRLMQTIDGGIFNGPLQRYILWPTHRLFTSSMRFGASERQVLDTTLDQFGMNGMGAKRLRQLSGDVIEHISSGEATLSIAELAAKPQIRKILQRLPLEQQLRVLGYAKQSRQIFDDWLGKQNAARVKRGQTEIPVLENYKPWVVERNLMSSLLFRDELPEAASRQAPMPDFIQPNTAFNPRALPRDRGLQLYQKERDLRKLMDDYIDTMSRDIFFTDIIRNGRAHTKALKSAGFQDSATTIDDWLSEAFAGTQSPHLRDTFIIGGERVGGSVRAIRRSLTRSVFPLNLPWNLVIQTSSIVNTLGRFGPLNTLHGLDYILRPSARKWVQGNVYSVIVKRQRGGGVAEQGLTYGNTPTMSGSLYRSKLDTATDVANFLTNVIEDMLTGISVRAAYHNGVKRGLKGRELAEWASEGGSKTQSMYNIHDRVGLLRSQNVQALAPFSSFSFEMLNTVRELAPLPRAARVGLYQDISRTHTERMRQILVFAAGMYAFNVVGDKLIDRKPWTLSAFLPFYGLLTGAMNPGSPRSTLLPLQYTKDFWNAVGSVIRHDNWAKMRRFGLRYHGVGGTQINRTVEGLIALAKGGVDDEAGKQLYRVDPDEWFGVITKGPAASRAGRERSRKRREQRGPLSDYIGFPTRGLVRE